MRVAVYEVLRVLAATVWLGCGVLMLGLLIVVSYAADWASGGGS